MNLGVERALNVIPVGGIVRYARSFYELLGNRRKAARLPTSGNIFATIQGIVADTTYSCLCIDISPKGIAIHSLEPITVGSTVRLHSDVQGPRRLARSATAWNATVHIGLD
jgi:hypothetical protein